jgi:N-formylmaleamate deformylase
MSAPEPLDVPANGINLRVWHWPAEKPPLLVVHGITNSARGWDFVCRVLQADFDVWSVDLRGHGDSDKPERGYSTADYAADLAGVVEALHLTRPDVLGHSLGARASARLAADRPDLIGRLVLVDPPSEARHAGQVEETMDAFLAGVRATREGGLEAARKANPHWTDEQLAARVEGHRKVSDRVMLAPVETFEPGSVLDDLPRIGAPTLFVYGDVNWREGSNRPGIVRPETAEKAGQLLSNGELLFVPRTGHMVPWDDFEGFIGPVRAFLLRGR